MIRPLGAALSACLLSGPAFSSCLVAGDSIAVGTAELLPGCSRDAKVGEPSAAIVGRVRPGSAVVVLSSGSNDALNPALERNLEAARARAAASRWIWIVPQPRVAAAIVRAVAARHGDAAVTFRPGRDGIHPASYRALARAVLARMQAPPPARRRAGPA